MRLKETARGSKFCVLRIARNGGDARDGIHQIVSAGSQRRVDFIVGEAVPLLQNVSRAVHQKIQDLLLCFAR